VETIEVDVQAVSNMHDESTSYRPNREDASDFTGKITEKDHEESIDPRLSRPGPNRKNK